MITDNELEFRLKALANKTRCKILFYLKEECRSAGEIAMQFSISAPSISYHLSILEKSHLISSCKVKGYIYYNINFLEIEEVIIWLKTFYHHQSTLGKFAGEPKNRSYFEEKMR